MSLTKADPNKQGWEDSVRSTDYTKEEQITKVIFTIVRNSQLFAKHV